MASPDGVLAHPAWIDQCRFGTEAGPLSQFCVGTMLEQTGVSPVQIIYRDCIANGNNCNRYNHLCRKRLIEKENGKSIS